MTLAKALKNFIVNFVVSKELSTFTPQKVKNVVSFA
jgi:hypothetical protein